MVNSDLFEKTIVKINDFSEFMKIILWFTLFIENYLQI
jgi:hypothetical protein